MGLDIDVTILFQAALVLLLLVILTQILLKPVMKVIDDRHLRIHGRKTEVERLDRLADENRTAYQARIHEARVASRREREGIRSEANEEARRMLADVRGEIADKLNATRDEVGRLEGAARDALAADTESMARQLVSKIIGREVSQ
jgi:F0F1-type ATP synthase membrane subunit b/b'